MKAIISLAISISLSVPVSVMAQSDNYYKFDSLRKAYSIQNNPLYTKSYGELLSIYATTGGNACQEYSRHLQGIRPKNNAHMSIYIKSIRDYAEKCRDYEETSPYTLVELLDPKAIMRYKHGGYSSMCDMTERQETRDKKYPSLEQKDLPTINLLKNIRSLF
ncbi:MAG: hypothetical protein ABW168_29275 [Sedimenticola sp.]